ncbi:unnamed protein product [Ectocarpus sp. 6 AP-2014]
MPYYYCRGYVLAATLTATALLSPATATPTTDLRAQTEQQRLAVVVPAYKGDLDRAVASLGRWPTDCSSVTQQNVDLVLYYAEGEEDAASVDAATTSLAESAGRCFAKTLTVYAHLSEEDDVYPRGPSVMFYKLFLDERIRSNFSEYDALAIIEWDVLVATDRSFEELYHAAFRVNEEFWVKGSNLEGTNFHSSSMMSDMWHVLGHINGNAIYNNNDQAFVEYVDYTRARWEDNYPYDVALWLTISDFPYSWPLYQRFSNKFVTTNLIAYVGKAHVDHGTVTDAIAGQTLFIHGKNVDEGSNLSVEKVNEANGTGKNGGASKVARKLQNWKENEKWKTFEEPKWQTSKTTKNDNVPKAARELQADSEDVYDRRRLTATQDGSAPKVARKLQKWRDANTESGKYNAPKVARKLQKWRDANKESGKNRWDTTETAKNENVPKAARRLQADSEDDVYTRRRLVETPTFAASADRVEVSRFFKMESERPFAEDVERHRVCAFVAGTASQVDQIEVTVSSVLEFVPGMRVVVAAEADAVDVYERAVGGLPGVSVSSTQSVFTASFFADEYCGVANTTLIYYLKTGSVVSRSITSKDTHSPQGDLLVVFGKGHSGDLADRTADVLGFEAPPFTTGTDLILPVGANADLRAALASEKTVNDAVGAIEDIFDLSDTAAVPQMLAALQYKRAAPGIWFFNPQEWVTNHLFQTASIWEIPLVKPRFTCELDPVSSADESDVADILQRNLDFFAMGGTCEGGVIAMQP